MSILGPFYSRLCFSISAPRKIVPAQSIAGPKSLHFRLLKRPKLTDQELELIGDGFPF